MKTTLLATGILALALVACGTATAGDCDKPKTTTTTTAGASCATGDAAQAAGQPGCCPLTAAKAAQASALQSTGCEKIARTAYLKAMAETVYANVLAEKHCAATAAAATYTYVKEQTGCCDSAATAYRHAVAKAAYDRCLGQTGCAKTADAEYEKASLAAAATLQKMTAEESPKTADL